VDYVIKNHNNLFIKLNEKGQPVSCSEKEKQLFEFSKAKNICDCLPKTLRKIGFKVEAVPDIPTTNPNKIVHKEEYIVSENITRWIEKFGTCSDILEEAKIRESQLCKELKKSDNELLDILHIIEIEPPKDLYHGWLLYKRIKKNRKERREIKDELIIVKDVIQEINPSCLHRKRIQTAINGLFNREYTFRIVEGGDDENDCV
jgi:hypothetical protein